VGRRRRGIVTKEELNRRRRRRRMRRRKGVNCVPAMIVMVMIELANNHRGYHLDAAAAIGDTDNKSHCLACFLLRPQPRY
jgi:hypothetical protein